MKTIRIFSVVLLGIALSGLGTLPTLAHSGTTQSSTALERGYRTGYSDGYNAGYKDISENAVRDYRSKEEFQRADRAYNSAWGELEDYRGGYQQGYAAGYEAGFDRRPFNSSVPAGLARQDPTNGDADQSSEQVDEYDTNTNPTGMTGNVLIPRDTVLLVALESSLSTDASQRGDRFQARVVEGEYQGAIVDGRVGRVKRPGRVKGVAELHLTFDHIRLPDNRSNNFNAELIDVVETGRDGVAGVDPEDGVKGKDSTKDNVTRVGAATGIGALIGAIAGGGKGAAIGAAIGGAAGTGSVVTQRGTEIRLDRGQQMRIQTTTDTRIN